MKLMVPLGIFLLCLWLLLSGHYDPLLISFGVVSVAFTLYMAHRMKVVDQESFPIHVFGKLLLFWLKLGSKIFTANVDVTLRVLGIKPVDPHLIRLKLDQSSDLNKVIYANSITLTPGSASLHIEDGYLYVHTISKEGADALLAGDIADILPEPKKGDAL